MSRVELYERIRKDSRDEGLSIRALSAKYRVHRRTVREALWSAIPPERKTPERQAPALGPWMMIIRAWLVADRQAPRKQRHTARRVHQRLVAEYGATVSESTVRAYVAQVNFELDNTLQLVTVPQTHGPGEEAECDFGEFMAWIEGVLVKCWMFCLRLSHSGRGFHVAFCHQAQEAFFEGHVLAFAHLGSVPARVRYDNLKAAVIKVLLGRDRLENERFVALRSHYGFDSFYCLPGIEGSHEKGGVEGEVGRFRRRHLVPVPRVSSLVELNELIAEGDRVDDGRHIARRAQSVGEAAAAERAWLRALPEEPFDSTTILPAVKVDLKGRICVRQSFYSVPVGLARRTITVRLGAQQLEAVADGKVVARHVRSLHKGTEDLVLDHYLEILVRKPGAMPGSTALAQARASGAFGPVHERFWIEARRRAGDGAGTRALIGVLLLQRRTPAAVVTEAMDAALAIGSVDPEVVAIEARRVHHRRPAAPVVPIGTGASDVRPVPRLAGYDSLLAAGERVMTAPMALSEPAAEAAIGAACAMLHLPTVRAEAAPLADTAAKERLTHRAYLAEVLSAEVDQRDSRRRTRRLLEARFPRIKRLEDFDPAAAPTINPATLAALGKGTWIDAGEPVVLIGDSGTGKSHLLIGLGVAAAETGRRVRYVTCAQLVNELAEAADERTLSKVVGRYGRLDLLLVDELGYVSVDPRGAELLFQVLTEREERASVAAASNHPFSEWGQTFTDPRLAAAVVDRMTFHAHIIETGTDSYRLRSARAKKNTKPQGDPDGR